MPTATLTPPRRTAASIPARKVRLNLELPESLKRQLDDLVANTQAASLSEVLRRSLALFDFCMDYQKQGGRLMMENPDGTREVLRIL